jgi:membrane dipeptidase
MDELKRRDLSSSRFVVPDSIAATLRGGGHAATRDRLPRIFTVIVALAVTCAGYPFAPTPGFAIQASTAAEPAAETSTAAAGKLTARPLVRVTPEALKLHRAALLIDGHNDLPWELRQHGVPPWTNFDIATLHRAVQTDIPRLRAGGVGAQFWSVWVPPRTAHDGTALKTTLEQIELVNAMLEHYPQIFEKALTAADIERIHAAGRIASLIGVEGGYSIENSLEKLRRLYHLGVRYMTLTHSETIDWADSATDTPRHDGLTPFGEQVVREMNRLGMLVDLAHVSDATMLDVLRVTQSPVIFSHSSARAIADHPRNVPDTILRQTARNGGLVMVNFYPGYIVPEGARLELEEQRLRAQWRREMADPAERRKALEAWRAAHPFPRGTVRDVVDHIEHIARVAGIDHVGIGSDFDGVGGLLPAQLEDVACFPNITQDLLTRGYDGEQIKKILGGNLLRVLRQAEAVARRLQAE